MAGMGNYRRVRELRKKPRRPFHYRATVMTAANPTPRACSIADISETGAKVTLEGQDELPDQFILVLTSNGSTRRLCRVVWRIGLTVGVKFAADGP